MVLNTDELWRVKHTAPVLKSVNNSTRVSTSYKLKVDTRKTNPFKLDEIFHSYHLDQSISILRVVGCVVFNSI